MRKIFPFMLLMILGSYTYAQQTIRSTVFDANSKKPLAGATVIYGNKKMITDKEGKFSFPCADLSKISISYIGYQSASISLTNCSVPDVFLNSAETTLENVEVSTSSNPNKALLYQPASIAKLGKTELNRGTGLYLDDAVQTNVPGVSMNRRSVGGGQQFNIRGYGNGARGTRGISSNFDGQGYKVYINGIALTDAEGITTLDDIDYASLQNVEITKGPAGSLYGLAISGAVNFTTTKAPKGETSVSQQVMLGNYGLQRFTTTLKTGGEHSSILLNYGNQKSDGYTIHNKSKKDFVNFMGDFQPNEKQSITTYFGYSNSYDERAGELTIQQFNNNDYSGNPEYIKRNAHSNVVSFRAGIGHTYNFSKNISNTTTVFGTGFNSNAASAGGWTDKSTMNFGLRSVFSTKINLSGALVLNGLTGIETQKQLANVIGYSMKKNPSDTGSSWVYGQSPYWVINTATSNFYTEAGTSSLFTEWTLAMPGDLSFTGGIGSSTQQLELNDRFNTALATRPDIFEKRYGNMISPHLAINKVFAKKLSVFASYSKGYKAPITSYFYITTPAVNTTPPTPPTGMVNENLKPEIGNQFEIGTRGEVLDNDLFFELIAFHTVFSNKLTAVSVASPVAPNTTLYAYMVNGGEQIHKGVEANLRWVAFESFSRFFRMIRPFANFTYSDFKYGDHFVIEKSVTAKEDYSNKQVAAVPKYSANLGIDINMTAGLYANFTYNYRDKMPITSLNDVWTESHNLLNGKIGMQRILGKHFTVDGSFGMNNITNTKYYIMVFANQLPDAYVPAPKNANYYGNLVLSYKF
ncbi:MAG TPA: TonB-dependent receptor [Chitinophagaceae bacterium]|nr:TonB-dependent receptor [Chitinophagaceae bacterium]